MSYLGNAAQLLVSIVFGALVALVLLRVLLQAVRANFHNPICQAIYRFTNPVLMPLRKLVPPWRQLDSAGVLLALLLTAIKLALSFALAGHALGPAGLLVMAVGDLVDFTLLVYLVLILAHVLLSYLHVDPANPAPPLIHLLCRPVLAPLRRLLPTLGGFDLSPLLAWLAILLARILVAAPIRDLGLALGA